MIGRPPIPETRAARLQRRFETLFGVAVLGYCIYYAYVRLRYGVSLSDEAFYAVVTQRFALGDRPYVDEINLRQTASLLTVPPYWLFLKLTGSTDGIIYFLRQIYFGLQTAVAAGVFLLLRRQSRLAYALLAAALPFGFVPFAMPAPSYNSLGALLFALGLVLALRRVLEPGSPRTLVFAGVVHALACFAYPPIALAVVIGTIGLRASTSGPDRRARWRPTLAYTAGLAATGLLMLAILAPSLIAGLPQALAYERMLTRPRTWEKVVGVARAAATLFPGHPAAALGLPVLVLAARRFAALRPWLVPVVLGSAAWWFAVVRPAHVDLVPEHTLSLHMMVYLGLLSGVFLLLLPDRAARKTLFLCGWLPGFAAGAVSAIASDNVSCMNAGLGLFAGAVVAPLLAVRAGEAASPGAIGRAPWARLPILGGLAIAPLVLVQVNYGATYWDGPVKHQTVRVTQGPYKGLRGVPGKAEQAEDLTREIRAVAKPGERMLVYYDQPAFYLAVPTRPALPTSWTDYRARIPVFLPYYQAHRTGRGLAISITGRQGTSRHLEELIENPGRLVKDAGWFRIYREPPP